MTATAIPSIEHDGAWLITLPPLILHVSTTDLQRLTRWLDEVGCDVGAELSEAVASQIAASLPLSPATCRWADCHYTATSRVTVNTVNGDLTYDLCSIHHRLVVP